MSCTRCRLPSCACSPSLRSKLRGDVLSFRDRRRPSAVSRRVARGVSGLFADASNRGSRLFDDVSALLEQAGDVDLVLLDLSMPGVRGFSGLMFLRAQFPGVPVVVVSANEDPAVIRRCMEFGASGFIPKTLGVEAMREAIGNVLEGGYGRRPMSISTPRTDAETADLVARLLTLTPQQVRVLMMLSEGLLNKQIAYELTVSEATVKAHVSAILQKLGVESRTQAVIAAAKIEAGQWPQARAAKSCLLRRRHRCDAPLRQQRAQRRRPDRLVQHLDIARARFLAHARAAVGGDEDRRQVGAEAPAQRRDRLDAVAAVEVIVDQHAVRQRPWRRSPWRAPPSDRLP